MTNRSTVLESAYIILQESGRQLFADTLPVAHMNGQKLALLLMENGLGVARRPHELFDIDDSIKLKGSADAFSENVDRSVPSND